jgi:hypothetical protein
MNEVKQGIKEGRKGGRGEGGKEGKKGGKKGGRRRGEGAHQLHLCSEQLKQNLNLKNLNLPALA